MQRLLLLTVMTLTLVIQTIAQCEDGRYRDFVFPDITVTSDILYGANLDYQESDTGLYLDIYEPTADMETARPLVIVVHGGSFISGSKEGLDVVPLCEDLARMGYVVASIQYRLGIPFLAINAENAKKAVIRGMHDSKAAVRFFRKDVAENGNTYEIDPAHIYMAGVSAGGFNALNVAYLNTDDEIPSDIDVSGPGLGGGAEGLSGNAGYSSDIAGVINVAGALAELDMMQANDVPVCSFHGTGDNTVPFGSDILTLLSVVEVDTVHGSESIHTQADALGVVNCLHVQWLEGHVPHVTNEQHYDTLLSVSSNFLSHLVCPEVALDCEFRDLQVISSVNELSLNYDLSIYPNPASTQLQITGDRLEQLTYLMTDLTGRDIMSGQLRDTNTQLDVSAMAPGIYVLSLTDGYAWQSLKVEVTR